MRGYQGKNVLVSGGDGFLGRPVVLRLLDLGAKVTIISGGGGEGPGAALLPGCPVYRPEEIDHLSFSGGLEAIIFLNHPVIMANHEIGTYFVDQHLSLLNKLLRLAGRNASYFLYASSVAVYGKQRYLPIDEDHPLEPLLLYGAIKLAGEYFCRAIALEYGFLYSIVRFGDLYGPGSRDAGEPALLLDSALRSKPLILRGSGGQVRTYLFIDDAVEATLRVLGLKPANQTVNIAGSEYISILHLAHLIKQGYSAKAEVKAGKSNLLDEIECCIDSRKAEGLLDFRPGISLSEGLSRTSHWILRGS